MMSPIFIVGVPRSGTTLLQSLLSASPETYSLPETHFFSTVLPTLNCQFLDPISPPKLAEASALIAELMELHFSTEMGSVLRGQAEQGVLTGKILFEAILEAYRPPTDVNRQLRVIEKTPLHIEYIPEILTHYPTAKFIHIARDPRDAISSILQTSFAPNQWLLWFTQYWNFAIKLIQDAEEKFPDAIKTIRYEDLIGMPELVLRKACEFTSIQFDITMLDNFSEGNTNQILAKESWKSRNREKRIYSQKRAWTTRLTHGEAWLIERLCQKYMFMYRYLPEANVSLRAKANVLWNNLHYLKTDPQALSSSLYLIKRYEDTGFLSAGRFLALILLFNNYRLFHIASVRKTIGI